MKYFSMFSGIGGFEYGIQRATLSVWDGSSSITESEALEQSLEPATEGVRNNRNKPDNIESRNTRSVSCVGYSEIDKYAIKVYERQFRHEQDCEVRANIQRTERTDLQSDRIKSNNQVRGDEQPQAWGNREQQLTQDINKCECKGHKNYGDATKINPKELPDFDLLVGGFPCQAFSIAGKRKGFDDTRGTLFFDIARILAEKKPQHLVLENVKGLLSHDQGRTFQTIIGVLADLGYRVEWQVLNSKDFGVPQNRERIIIVGHLGECCGRKVFPIAKIARQTIKTIGQINNAQSGKVYSIDGISTTLAANGGGNGAKTGLYAIDLTRRQPNNYKIRKDNRAGTLDANYYKGLANQERPGVKDGTRIRRLTPKECERLQGFPDDWTKYGIGDELISDTQRYKMCGNAVTTNVITAVMERLI